MIKIHNYSVNKYFGHFWQAYIIKAESKEDAWERAERDGKLQYQQVYREEKDINSRGYVKDLDDKMESEEPISNFQYWDWMREAIEKGMHVTSEEYEQAFSVPFHNIVINSERKRAL